MKKVCSTCQTYPTVPGDNKCKTCRSILVPVIHEIAEKIELLTRLGLRCVVCDFDDIRALEIEHKQATRAEIRTRSKSANSEYRYLLSLSDAELEKEATVYCCNHHKIYGERSNLNSITNLTRWGLLEILAPDYLLPGVVDVMHLHKFIEKLKRKTRAEIVSDLRRSYEERAKDIVNNN